MLNVNTEKPRLSGSNLHTNVRSYLSRYFSTYINCQHLILTEMSTNIKRFLHPALELHTLTTNIPSFLPNSRLHLHICIYWTIGTVAWHPPSSALLRLTAHSQRRFTRADLQTQVKVRPDPDKMLMRATPS